MASSKYTPLGQDASEEQHEHEACRSEKASLARAQRTVYALLILLTIATACNILLFVQMRNTRAQLDVQSYVGLQRDIPTPIPHDNRTIDDEMWEAPEFDTFVGMVALSDEFAEEKGLLRAQRFPWDSSKGIYVFHGYHSLHCVLVIRQTIMEYRDNKPLSWVFSHVTHCLHVLREDVTCNADDLPRYTGKLHGEAGKLEVSSGTGEIRMCRDWSKLREFALKNSACYRRPLDHPVQLIDRYKFCPDGSKPWEKNENSQRRAVEGFGT